ncbi:MAG: hypothetical protein IPH57_03225 [Saprospiraceae bacterium]|nr:hypothetical protein [Saprospiraceae bacterium]
MTYVDNTTSYYCESPAQIVTRTWTATDLSGNSTSCVQTISVLAPDLSTFTWPVNYDGLPQNEPMLECGGEYPGPHT